MQEQDPNLRVMPVGKVSWKEIVQAEEGPLGLI